MISVGIFGANGYLGGVLKDMFCANQINCQVLGRSIANLTEETIEELTHIVDCGFPRNHMTKGVRATYLQEIEERVLLCKNYKINYLYVGSYSSANSPLSQYGKTKYEAETIVATNSLDIVRVGLVFDSARIGGRALELERIINKLPIVPIPNIGWYPLQITYLNDFESWILNYLETKSKDFSTLVHSSTLNEIIRMLAVDKTQIQLPRLITGASVVLVKLLPLRLFDSLKSIATKVSA
jgi:hypothetical protein